MNPFTKAGAVMTLISLSCTMYGATLHGDKQVFILSFAMSLAVVSLAFQYIGFALKEKS